MPAEAPERISDPRQRELYRDLSRVFEDYCGEKEELWPEREQEFCDILFLVDEKIRFKEEAFQ